MGSDPTPSGTRSIAGEQAYCYGITGEAAVAFTMEAMAYSTTVPDSDFTLPATPIKVP